jgi:hypothetical protein
MSYHHNQRSRAIALLMGVGALVPIWLLASGRLAAAPVGARITTFVALIVLAISAFVFSSFSIAISGGQLSWWFGPGVVKRTVPLSTIVSATPATTSMIDGWGIHLTARGWLYNVAGRQAVVVRQKDGTQFLLGTDEPQRLVQAIMDGAGRER